MRRLAAFVCALTLAGACGDNPTRPIALDGSPRYPDAEGVVQRASSKQLTLDGGRRYGVSAKVQSFVIGTLATAPLSQRRGQYVQVGLNGKKVTWIASVGRVTLVHPPVVYVVGRLKLVDSRRRLVFTDGTVLRLAPAVTSPVTSGFVRADIDPAKHVVVQVALP